MTKPRISIEEFSKIEVKVGTVLTAERVPNTDKLLRLTVDFGMMPMVENTTPVVEERDVRQIVSGIAAYVPEPATLIGRQLAFVTNLEPRTIKGLESNGMLFAAGDGDSFAFMVPDRTVPPGTSTH
jgi:methionyl-tRNA synthetase